MGDRYCRGAHIREVNHPLGGTREVGALCLYTANIPPPVGLLNPICLNILPRILYSIGRFFAGDDIRKTRYSHACKYGF